MLRAAMIINLQTGDLSILEETAINIKVAGAIRERKSLEFLVFFVIAFLSYSAGT